MAKFNYKSEDELNRVSGWFDTLNKEAAGTQAGSSDAPTNSERPVLTMSCLGKLGRFGNQLMQYAFLRICAKQSGAHVECPPWIGQTLFGHHDPPITRRLPPAIERWDTGDNLFDRFPEFIPYLEKLAGAKSCRVSWRDLGQGLQNVDLWGFFQIHTRLLQPHKEHFRSIFRPASHLKPGLEEGLKVLRSKGRTVIGIHLRRGDFATNPVAGFTFVVPSKWWCNWLEERWSQFDNPVLFLCSDELDRVIGDFKKFSPVTWKDLYATIPQPLNEIDFYVDFNMLSHCDIVGISNSTFSFIASLLNERARLFVRPQWHPCQKLVAFDPWDSDQLLYCGGAESKLFKSYLSSLHVAGVTQGVPGIFKCVFTYPLSWIKMWGIRAYMGYQVEGVGGIFKTLLKRRLRRSV